jgi:hypothetical protein
LVSYCVPDEGESVAGLLSEFARMTRQPGTMEAARKFRRGYGFQELAFPREVLRQRKATLRQGKRSASRRRRTF